MTSRVPEPVVQQRLIELADGVAVEEDTLRIAEKIKAYDPNLRVQFVDPSQAEFGDAPFRIIEHCPDGFDRVAMYAWTLDERVLDRIMLADTNRVDVLAALNASNNRARDQERRRYQEQVAAVSEMVQGVLASPKDTYTATNPVTGERHKFRSLKQSD